MFRQASTWILLSLLALVLALPFALRRSPPPALVAEDTVVVVTPHPESVRQEFGRAFAAWYEARTGRRVAVDWRVVGGTSEISRYLFSEYTNAFRNHWVNSDRRWTPEIEAAQFNHRLQLGADPAVDDAAQAARRAWLASEAGCGVDVFFGGGTYEFTVHARAGTLVDAGLLRRQPAWFQETAVPGEIPAAIPRSFAGETYYDREGRWYGVVLTNFGIIANREAVTRLGIERLPETWADLADPRYAGALAVCDPTKSGSITQAMEMVMQQQMQQRLAELQAAEPQAEPKALEARAVAEGWDRGLRLLVRICANARYITDSAQKPNLDVAAGDCAAGMSIDFYARSQQENVEERGRGPAAERFVFVLPQGGTTTSADPIGLLRGAPHRAVAEALIEYALSPEGQRLWALRAGEAGGPVQYALRRPPIRPSVYAELPHAARSDPELNPYVQAAGFRYRPEWTASLFSELRVIIRVACIDSRPELLEAWAAIRAAQAAGREREAATAEALLDDMSLLAHARVLETIRPALRAGPRAELDLTRELGAALRAHYQRVARAARTP